MHKRGRKERWKEIETGKEQRHVHWLGERKKEKKNGEENGRGGSMGRLPLLYVHSPAPSPKSPILPRPTSASAAPA